MSDFEDEPPAGVGHNSTLNNAATEKLRQIVARIERLEEEKDGIAADIKEVYGEAKATGYDTKVLRKVIAARKKDRKEREEFETVFDLYMAVFE